MSEDPARGAVLDDPPPAPSGPRPGTPRRRDRLGDPIAWGLAVLAGVAAVTTVLVNEGFNDGHFAPPLDDVYIHLQYARRIGVGELLRYMPGDPPTTGASSLLYVLLLGAVAALGVGGGTLLLAAVAFGTLCFVGTVVGVFLLGRELASRAAGAAAGVLTALCGPLLWGATSGMEVGLVALLVVAVLLAFVREQPRARFVATPLLATLLALARPEGVVLVAAVLLGAATVLVAAWRRGRGTPLRALTGLAWLLLPVVAVAAQLALYRSLTGTPENTGLQAKSWFALPVPYPQEIADRMSAIANHLVGVFGGTDSTMVAGPATLLLVLLGLAGLALGERPRRVLAGVLVLGFAGVLAAVSTLMTAELHNARYLQPFLPVVLLLSVLGARVIARAVPDRRIRRQIALGVVGVLVATTLLALPTWMLRSGQQGAAIRESSASAAAWLRGNTPPGARVAVNDVGATAYLSGRTTVDLIGLTTPGFAAAANAGPGALYEALVRLPPDRRPGYFSIFARWKGPDVGGLRGAAIFSREPLISFRIQSPVRDGSPFPAICQTSGQCPLIDVWSADWRHVGSGDRPDAPVPGRIVDRVNVGDLVDEAAHGYRVDPALPGVQPMTVVRHQGDPYAPPGTGGPVVVDSGRHVVGGETFTLRGLTPGRPVTLVARVDATEADPTRDTEAGVVSVAADGRPVGDWEFTHAGGTPWTQSTYLLPPPARDTLTVTLAPRKPYLAPFPDYESFSYWATQ